MPSHITHPDSCMQCNMCSDVCPVAAIIPGGYGTATRQAPVEIDPNLCTDCGECVNTCPNNCLTMED